MRVITGLAIAGAIPLTLGAVLWVVGSALGFASHPGWGGLAQSGVIMMLAGLGCGLVVVAAAAIWQRRIPGILAAPARQEPPPDGLTLTPLASPEQQEYFSERGTQPGLGTRPARGAQPGPPPSLFEPQPPPMQAHPHPRELPAYPQPDGMPAYPAPWPDSGYPQPGLHWGEPAVPWRVPAVRWPEPAVQWPEPSGQREPQVGQWPEPAGQSPVPGGQWTDPGGQWTDPGGLQAWAAPPGLGDEQPGGSGHRSDEQRRDDERREYGSGRT